MLSPMFVASFVSLVIAVAAGLYGFGVVSDEAPLAAKLCSAFFLLLALASFWWVWMGRAIGKSPPRFTGRGRASEGRLRLTPDRRALPT